MGNYSNKNTHCYGEEYISEDFESTMTIDDIYKALDDLEDEIAREENPPEYETIEDGEIITVEMETGTEDFQIARHCQLNNWDFYLLYRISDEGIVDKENYLIAKFTEDDQDVYLQLVEDDSLLNRLYYRFGINIVD